MIFKAVELKCPNCGASISLDTKKCEYCDSPLIIHTASDPASVSDEQIINSTAQSDLSDIVVFLKSKLYDNALSFCDSAIKNDFRNTDAYFYSAIALLKGKRAFLTSTSTIKKAEERLQTAISINPKGIYYYLWSYLRLDHYNKKFYKASPDYKELYYTAKQHGLTPDDIKALYDVLDVEKPSEL